MLSCTTTKTDSHKDINCLPSSSPLSHANKTEITIDLALCKQPGSIAYNIEDLHLYLSCIKPAEAWLYIQRMPSAQADAIPSLNTCLF